MNEYIASLVDELYNLGVRHVVLSPGSRSTPLSVLFCAYEKHKAKQREMHISDENFRAKYIQSQNEKQVNLEELHQPKFSVYMNLDERSAAFFALGIAKEKNSPVVLVCTSGSAPSHYLPALNEAKHSRIPLIILSADRPPEFKNVGAPQTMNQEYLFGTYVKYYENLSYTPESLAENNDHSHAYTRSVMQKVFMACQSAPKGAVQINVPLYEPLLPNMYENMFEKGMGAHGFRFIKGEQGCEFDAEFFLDKQGIIVCGAGACDYSKGTQEELVCLSKKLNAPLLADPLSQLRNYVSDTIIDSYDIFLKSEKAQKELEAEYIILLGQVPVSKRLQQFIAKNKQAYIIQVDEVAEYRDFSMQSSFFVQSSAHAFATSLNQQIDQNMQAWQSDFVEKKTKYLAKWQGYEEKSCYYLGECFSCCNDNAFFEGKIIHLLQKNIAENSALMLANSMSIREIDFFWRSKAQNIRYFCNRGVNGIDGTISTALGIASQRPTVLLTGDLAFWHDMNGLLVGKTHQLDLVIVLLNNNGGGIFNYLPQYGCDNFSYLYTTPHDLDFSAIKNLYQIKHVTINDYNSFEMEFCKAQQSQGIHLLEVQTNMDLSKKLHGNFTNLPENLC